VEQILSNFYLPSGETLDYHDPFTIRTRWLILFKICRANEKFVVKIGECSRVSLFSFFQFSPAAQLSI